MKTELDKSSSHDWITLAKYTSSVHIPYLNKIHQKRVKTQWSGKTPLQKSVQLKSQKGRDCTSEVVTETKEVKIWGTRKLKLIVSFLQEDWTSKLSTRPEAGYQYCLPNVSYTNKEKAKTEKYQNHRLEIQNRWHLRREVIRTLENNTGIWTLPQYSAKTPQTCPTLISSTPWKCQHPP